VNVLVDTAIWSEALRRRKVGQRSEVAVELASLVQDGRVIMIGPVRQEILSGIKEQPQFDKLREHLRAFPDVPITTADHEEAAAHCNRCRRKGIQGSNTDFLICAMATRNDWSIFTVDDDFKHFAKVLSITLHRLPA
jgi:predicted nucleic acid-binding protein